MSLKKQSVVDQIEITKSGVVQVRTATHIMEDGVEITSKFHRHVVVPGDDFSKEDSRVQAICKATHTKDVVAAYKAAQAEQLAG